MYASAKVNYANALAQVERYTEMNKQNAASTQNLQTLSNSVCSS